MNEIIQHIAEQLKKERLKKKWTQRVLSAKTGMPQNHLSKIESGLVDVQLSTLISLGRALGLELMMVPRSLALTFEALMREPKKMEPQEHFSGYPIELDSEEEND